MELLIIWLICGVVAASIYHQKRRFWLWGLIAGVVLGPLGVLLALASGRGNQGRCPYCRETLDRQARVCPHCRSALSAA